MNSEQSSRLGTVEAERMDLPPTTNATLPTATLDALPAEQFDALIRLGSGALGA